MWADSLLDDYFKNVRRTKPSKRTVQNVSYWLENIRPLVESESAMLDDVNDLVCPMPSTTRSKMETLVEEAAAFLQQHGYGNVGLHVVKPLRYS